MKKLLFFMGLVCLGYFASGQPHVALENFLSTEGLQHAAIGISVKRVSDGKTVIAYNPQMALTPASVAKLLPTWFALQEKGAAYRYRTTLYYTGSIRDGVLYGNIVLYANGDPTFNSRYFPHNNTLARLVAAIQEAGIREIVGRVIITGAETGADIPGSWVWEDISNYYGAMYLPFNYRDNTYTLKFRTGAAGSPAQLLSVTPALPGIRFQNEVIAKAGNKDDAWIFGGPYASVLCVKGTLPANRPAFSIKGAMHEPAKAFVHELEGMLKNEGIAVRNEMLPDTNRVDFLHLDSPTLQEIVFHTNKASVNLFAEALGALVGEGNWQDEVKALLAEAGIDDGGVVLHDACGLSPLDAVPAQVLTDLLVYIGNRQHEAFLLSLPIAGIDGGLAGYCYSFPDLKDRLRAKTGSMSGVRCLSGYLTCFDGERLAFTVLINHYTCSVSQLQKAIGKFLSAFL